MEENLKKLLEIHENQLIDAFAYNNIKLMFVENKEQLQSYLKEKLVDHKKVALGGSVTLSQLGVIDLIRESDVDFIDRYEKGITPEELSERLRAGLLSDLFITGTNALTMDGCLYNVDGTGNRVAAMIYGPKEVIVVAGLNKIFNSEQEAIQHIKHIAAPANAIRLNRNTPCAKTGHCHECHSTDRICCSYVKLGYQRAVNRIKIIIVKDNYGY